MRQEFKALKSQAPMETQTVTKQEEGKEAALPQEQVFPLSPELEALQTQLEDTNEEEDVVLAADMDSKEKFLRLKEIVQRANAIKDQINVLKNQ